MTDLKVSGLVLVFEKNGPSFDDDNELQARIAIDLINERLDEAPLRLGARLEIVDLKVEEEERD